MKTNLAISTIARIARMPTSKTHALCSQGSVSGVTDEARKLKQLVERYELRLAELPPCDDFTDDPSA
jgi:hypothetical protein